MNGIIQFAQLGNPGLGRFGNQMSEYIFARKYAESIGARLETNEWLGQKIFQGINDPPPSRKLEQLDFDQLPFGSTNIELFGIFQSSEARAIWDRAYAKKIYQIKPELLHSFKKPHEPLVCAHLRRGDFCRKDCWFHVVTRHAYEKAIKQYGYRLEDVVWVSDRKPGSWELSDMSLVPDFLTLVHADVLFMANNTTFSWWAAMIGNAKVYAACVGVVPEQLRKPGNERLKYVSPEFREYPMV